MSTLKDVAEKAGVTVTTVSRVINNRGYISEKTRKKVYDVMREIGYLPNEAARSLSKKSANVIGVIVPDIEHPYFAKLVNELESAAAAAGYKVMLCSSRNNAGAGQRCLEALLGSRVSGIVLCGGYAGRERTEKSELPVVTIECEGEQGDCDILCDNYEGGGMAADLLLKAGCGRLVCFEGQGGDNLFQSQRRLGFLEMCQKKHVPHCKVDVLGGDGYTVDCTNEIADFLKNHPALDGIFATSDLIAMQVVRVCYALGRKIPDDVMIVGFSDVYMASVMTPSLSTIKQPVREMAELAVRVILEKSKGNVIPAKVVLPVTMAKRESTK